MAEIPKKLNGTLTITYDNTNIPSRRGKKLQSESVRCNSEEGAYKILLKRNNVLTAILKWGKGPNEQKQLK